MAAKRKEPKTYYEDGIALVALKPDELYSARVRMDPDAHLGGPHEKWYWSKTRKIKAPSKAKALVKAERYRRELVDGDGGANMLVGKYARQWQDERKVQAEATFKSTGVAKRGTGGAIARSLPRGHRHPVPKRMSRLGTRTRRSGGRQASFRNRKA